MAVSERIFKGVAKPPRYACMGRAYLRSCHVHECYDI
jgi:hypothetical protein